MTEQMHRMDELLRAIQVADEQIACLASARAEAVAELEQLLRENGMEEITNGNYRARRVRRLKVLSEEQLAQIAPDLVEVQQITRLKVDMRKLNAAWSTPLHDALQQVVNEVEVFEVGQETRKTVREVIK